MPKNIKDMLIDATKFPAAVEAKLPAEAPKISTMLVDAAEKLPVVPDLPVEVPVLPEPPELPEAPGGAEGLRGLTRRFATRVEVVPTRGRTSAPAPNLRSKESRLVFE